MFMFMTACLFAHGVPRVYPTQLRGGDECLRTACERVYVSACERVCECACECDCERDRERQRERPHRKGMDPKLRLSGGDWFSDDPNYALSRAISRRGGAR
jgi:hypothetical protein